MRFPIALLLGLSAGAPFAARLSGQAAAAGDTAAAGALQVGAMVSVVGTRADPAYAGRAFTELQLVQPIISVALTGRSVSFLSVLNAEGYTLRRGELTAGIWGEGYVDRRHPHTLVHEAMLVWQPLRLKQSPGAAFAFSLAAGRGFVPFGSDDPMMRPLEKYPVNHHHAQIIERIQTIGALRISRGDRFVSLEGASFNGDEPAGPFHGPRWERLGDSWSVRTTLQPIRGIEASVSEARVKSPELQQGGAFDHRQHHASLRIDRTNDVTGAVRYLLAEWARTDEITNGKTAFRYRSALVEGAYGWRGVRGSARFEQTERGEQSRLIDPFRAPIGHVDFQNLGVTRWRVATVALSARNFNLQGGHKLAMSIAPFAELARATPTPARRPTVFEPADFYGSSKLWSISVGLRLQTGTMRPRMGRYGVMSSKSEHSHHAM